ncbi:hypothetical protein PHAVU_002G170600 [Phaseolus vulgaris]|uniref:Dof-type domain-containing protein n=1 Tax=Phaseolus vulgaris TaxID=3885 RepID=V7CKF4_PHAVU|nr:hypothetical protein PHAVU_002G170600g [Phaseolus vulgaris]ESW30642.1 hypothetical protein PHAVU_002G170600g [Phaseolus vulgaris]
MSEVKGSEIKLFGRTISLPHNDSSSPACLSCPSSSSSPQQATSATQQRQEDQEPIRKELTSLQDDDASSHQTTEDLKSPASGILDNPKTPSAETETSLQKSSANGEQSETTSASEDKTPKKPDKILPCPRCNSMDTKFCYYNNYNVNQPRHFCKNCQRYWTAGGTMRNVPVGAGRRKNKNISAAAASHYRQIMIPEALQGATLNASNGLHNALLRNRAGVLTFGPDTPLCDTMSSVLSIAERAQSCVSNGFHGTEPNSCVSYSKEGGHSNGVSVSTTSASSHTSSHESVDERVEGFSPQLSYFPGAPWPYPMPRHTVCPPSYPLSFYTTPAYWGCMPPSWNMPCMSPQSSVTNPVSAPILGKHSRNGNIITPSNSQKEMRGVEHSTSEHNFLIPKTLRIDDPGETARSSMWSKLGTKNDRASSGGLFQAFPPKGNDMNRMVEASPELQANPAALSRSLTFHEQT